MILCPRVVCPEHLTVLDCSLTFQLMNDDHTLYHWLKTLEQTGLCLLTEIPCKTGQLKQVGERVAFLKKTNYG